MSSHSDFWINNFGDDESDIISLIRLSAARRVIGNYVTIMTGENIPVTFNNKNKSFTDGKQIVIGKDIDKKENFDVAVGLTLHESGHILYTDFDTFLKIYQNIPQYIWDISEKLNIQKLEVEVLCKTVLNVIEDRYIDYIVYSSAPGYREYYKKLYDKYFNDSSIDDGLKSQLYRTPCIESYLYRIINLTNKNTDLTALPGLYDIAKKIDLSNIQRLRIQSYRFELSLEVTYIILSNICKSLKKDDIQQQSDDLGGEDTGLLTPEQNEESKENDIGEDYNLSEQKKKKIESSFKKQKDFLSGDIIKKKITDEEKSILDILEKSKIDIKSVASDYKDTQFGRLLKVDCIVVKKLTRELLLSMTFPLSYKSYDGTGDKQLQEYIDSGISMGIKIGKRLQFRNEVNIDKFTRRETGKLDKRIIHELGWDNENIFYQTRLYKYKKINIHISVDASGSMDGDKWLKTMKLCTSIAKSASVLENINVTISLRTTLSKMAYIVMAYDSKVDHFCKIKNLFCHLKADRNTPEGLCFEAILNELPTCNSDTQGYFINISDGEPCFIISPTEKYIGVDAANHTKLQVNKIRSKNYKVISYFITDGVNCDKSKKLFKIMYGQDAVFIDVGNMNQIVTTLNKKLMENIDN